ncbi:MAG: TPM domain-containing protein [Methylacidiphilales bacterium]|nr:TPM domain-containing protein [Candidatus Methylacidiphilales bacterium]
MKVKQFLNSVEHARVHQAIRSAEEGTSGDIVVFISHRHVKEPLDAANREFRKLRLDAAGHDNSMLIFLAPKSQKFAVVGGGALHQKVGQGWWHELVELLTRHFKESRFTDGLVATIERAGGALKTHFPATATDRTGQRDIVEE